MILLKQNNIWTLLEISKKYIVLSNNKKILLFIVILFSVINKFQTFLYEIILINSCKQCDHN